MSSDTDRQIIQIHILLYKIVPQILISQIALIMFINLFLIYNPILHAIFKNKSKHFIW